MNVAQLGQAIRQEFKPADLVGLEWQKIIARTTSSGCWKVTVTWALDKFRIEVIALHSAFGEGRVIKRVHAWYARTAAQRANRLFRAYEVKK